MEKRPTYARYAIHQILPAVGWQGVWWMNGRHEVIPVHLLALVTRTRYDARTMQALDEWEPGTPDAEKREVVGMELTDCGFSVCDEASNYCGLLAPDMDLAAFEAWDTCHHPHGPPPPAPGAGKQEHP